MRGKNDPTEIQVAHYATSYLQRSCDHQVSWSTVHATSSAIAEWWRCTRCGLTWPKENQDE